VFPNAIRLRTTLALPAPHQARNRSGGVLAEAVADGVYRSLFTIFP
jgi:hypothetical protein